jgi:hypothetical protein
VTQKIRRNNCICRAEYSRFEAAGKNAESMWSGGVGRGKREEGRGPIGAAKKLRRSYEKGEK